MTIDYTLVTDGRSDRVLINIVDWCIENIDSQIAANGTYADFSALQKPPRNLSERIEKALELYTCDWLFIHRDAENQSIDDRCSEIEKALQSVPLGGKPYVFIIPIKMTEAWLLMDSDAIKRAAGNRNYKGNIELPSKRDLENIDAKKKLFDLLLQAKGSVSKREKIKFNKEKAVHLVAEYTDDFSGLFGLSAFDFFYKSVKKKLTS